MTLRTTISAIAALAVAASIPMLASAQPVVIASRPVPNPPEHGVVHHGKAMHHKPVHHARHHAKHVRHHAVAKKHK